MKQFVFLFRKGPRKLAGAEDKRRGDEVKVWAAGQATEGRALDLRIFGQEVERVQPDDGSDPDGAIGR